MTGLFERHRPTLTAAIEAAGDMSDPKARARAAREIEEAITEMTRLLTSIVAPA